MSRAGRKTKLTPKLQETICTYIKQGYTIEQSCALSGITPRTYYNWIKRGKQAKTGKFFQFFQKAKQAEEIAEAKYLATIIQAAAGNPSEGVRGDWRAAAWYLERKNPDRWSKTEKLQQDIRADVKQRTDLRARIREAREYFDELSGGG